MSWGQLYRAPTVDHGCLVIEHIAFAFIIMSWASDFLRTLDIKQDSRDGVAYVITILSVVPSCGMTATC